MNSVVYDYTMDSVSVDEAASAIEEFCSAAGINRKDVLRLRLTAENVILRWSEHKVSDRFRMRLGRQFRKFYISLECIGLPFDPFDEDEDNDGVFVREFRQRLGINPHYSYKNGINRSVLYFKAKEASPIKKILFSIAAAFAVGALAKIIFPEVFVSVIVSSFIDPLYSAIFRLLGYVAGPLILFSVIWGIYGIGDTATLGRLGKDLILRYLLVSLALSIFCTLTFPIFNLNFTQVSEGESVFKSIFEMLLDIIPSDIITPLTTNNTLQIIFSAVIIGIAMLFLGKEVHTIADIVEQVNAIVCLLMEFISRLIPVVVFLIVVRMILSDTLSMFLDIWLLAVLFIAECLIFCTVVTIITAIKLKVSPWLLFKKSIPTLIITFTTASSTASISSNMETCENSFGIDNSLSGFGIPLGMVIYKTASVIYDILICLYFAHAFNVPCSPSWLFAAGFISFMMSFSAPPVPGGGVIAYTLLFDRLGIPADALAMVIAVDVIIDFLLTSVNIYCLPLALINSAHTNGLLNRDILRSKAHSTVNKT